MGVWYKNLLLLGDTFQCHGYRSQVQFVQHGEGEKVCEKQKDIKPQQVMDCVLVEGRVKVIWD